MSMFVLIPTPSLERPSMEQSYAGCISEWCYYFFAVFNNDCDKIGALLAMVWNKFVPKGLSKRTHVK